MAGVGCGGGMFRSVRVRPRCAHCHRGEPGPGRGEPNRSMRGSPPGFGAPNRPDGTTEATSGGLPTLRGRWFQGCACRHNPIPVGQGALPWSAIPSGSAGPGCPRHPHPRGGSVREHRGRRLPGGIRRAVPWRHGAAGAVGLGARRPEHGGGHGLKADPAGFARVVRRWEPSCRAEALAPDRIP